MAVPFGIFDPDLVLDSAFDLVIERWFDDDLPSIAFTGVQGGLTPAAGALDAVTFSSDGSVANGLISTRTIVRVQDATNSQLYDTTGSGSIHPTIGGLGVVCVIAQGSVADGTLTTLSGGTTTYTLIATALTTSSANKMLLFVADTLYTSNGTTHIQYDTGAGDTATGCIILWAELLGMSRAGSSAVKQTKTVSNHAVGTPTATFDVEPDRASAIWAFMGTNATPNITPPDNFTEIGNEGTTLETAGGEMAARVSGFEGTTVTWGSASPGAYGVIIAEFDTSDGADLSATLAAATLSSDGTVSDPVITGDESSTLDDATLSATATSDIAADLSVTTDNAALSATGDAGTVTGDEGTTLEDVTLSSTGDAGTITGDFASTLDDVTISATASSDIGADESSVLDDTVLSATASSDIAAGLIVTLDDATFSSTGDAGTNTADEASLLANASLSATAVSDISGDTSITLDDIVFDASGGSPAIIGDASIVLDDVTILADAISDIVGTESNSLEDATLVADAVALIIGDLAIVLDDVVLEVTILSPPWSPVYLDGSVKLVDSLSARGDRSDSVNCDVSPTALTAGPAFSIIRLEANR